MSGVRALSPFAWAVLLSLLVAVLGAACAQRSEPRFPHLAHLTAQPCGTPSSPLCLNCNTCHRSEQDGSRTTPHDTALCSTCHGGSSGRIREVVERPRVTRGTIAFDHDRHLSMPGIQGQCVPCHGGVVKSGASPMPPMSQCFTCHEHEEEWRERKCVPCHQTRDLRHTLPETFLRHDAGFARHHGQLAAEDARLCQSCHEQSDCNECHDTQQTLTREHRRPEKVDAISVHGGGFLVRHALEARAEPARCARCHAPDTCDSCHRERGVSPALVAGRSPHPPGWVGTNTKGSSFHGREARRDLLACASCHDQGPLTNCIRCHKVGAYGGNPHPGGWQSAQSPQQGMCRYCHE